MKKMFLLFCLGLASCTTASRTDTAQSIAQHAQLAPTQINAAPFNLTLYERVTQSGQIATIYIEGDGLAWVSRSTASLDPTPKNPIALELASLDIAPNVIYMARPCQYSRMITMDKACPQKYWTSHRFAPDVINAMNNALSQIKDQYGFTGFHLVGFSGGAAVATLISAERDDVLSLRTVAGNLDHVTLHNIHNVSQTPQSLNPVDVAQHIAHIPQIHFIGRKDGVIPPAIFENFYRASENSDCVQSVIVPNATHEKGWPKVWPALLQYSLKCKN